MAYYTTSGQQLDEFDLEEMFNEFLDETHEEVTIAGITIAPCVILKRVDPIAHRVIKWDWIDAEIQAGNIIEKDNDDDE